MSCNCPSVVCACQIAGVNCACNCAVTQPLDKRGRKGLMMDKQPRCCACDPPGMLAVKHAAKGPAGRFPVDEKFDV